MTGKKVVYIISDIEKALAFEWTAQKLHSRYDLHFILIGKRDTPLGEYLKGLGIDVIQVTEDQFRGTIKKWLYIFSVLRRIRPTLVHAHMWRATLLGLTAAWLAGVEKRIFTRHHAMIHYKSFQSGRKWDKLCNWLATDIVAISENVRNILITKDNASASKIHLIHHGFDLHYFQDVDPAAVDRMRAKYEIPKLNNPIIGVVSRYLELKGIQYVIPAFQKLRETFPSAHLILANAHGDYALPIKNLLSNLPRGSYSEILFEQDLSTLYKLFSVFVHVPIDKDDEAFGQTYVEALAAGVPSVFTLSGVAPEFIVHQLNALVVPYCDPTSIEKSIRQILLNPHLAESLSKEGQISVQQFSLERMISKLDTLYG